MVDEGPPDTTSLAVRGYIDRIFQGIAVSNPRPVKSRIGVAPDLSITFGHQIRKSRFGKRTKAIRHLTLTRRIDFERCCPVLHRMGIDRRDGGDVGDRRPPYHCLGHVLPIARSKYGNPAPSSATPEIEMRAPVLRSAHDRVETIRK